MKNLRSDYLICYDVKTTSAAGEWRLRNVAKACERYGQRVQYSVFECFLSEMLLDRLRSKLLDIYDSDVDSIRIYNLSAPGKKVEVLGQDRHIDFHAPLIT
jgi:CRISPR-associated protein Cas2